jgi:hypothetical protein
LGKDRSKAESIELRTSDKKAYATVSISTCLAAQEALAAFATEQLKSPLLTERQYSVPIWREIADIGESVPLTHGTTIARDLSKSFKKYLYKTKGQK